MATRRRRRQVRHGNNWKLAKKCALFFTTICIAPVVLVLLVTTDQYMRPVGRSMVGHSFNQDDNLLYSTMDLKNNMTAIKERLNLRKKHLHKACKYLGLDIVGNDSLHKPNPWEFLINRQYNLVWCNVFKAGSTSWMYNFNILAGYSEKFLRKTNIVPLHLARRKYPRPSINTLKKAFNNSVSFLIVRHPFERLLSAYRDKLQFALPNSLHRRLGMQIIKKYRKKYEKTRWPTFSEFAQYVIDTAQNQEPLDMHWTPITQFCTPCMFDFNIVAHTETFQEDQKYLIKVANLENVIKPQWKNAGHGQTDKKIEKFYSELTRSQILHLYHIYRYDFELFNYSIRGYLELGQPDTDPSVLLAAITRKHFLKNITERAPMIY